MPRPLFPHTHSTGCNVQSHRAGKVAAALVLKEVHAPALLADLLKFQPGSVRRHHGVRASSSLAEHARAATVIRAGGSPIQVRWPEVDEINCFAMPNSILLKAACVVIWDDQQNTYAIENELFMYFN